MKQEQGDEIFVPTRLRSVRLCDFFFRWFVRRRLGQCEYGADRRQQHQHRNRELHAFHPTWRSDRRLRWRPVANAIGFVLVSTASAFDGHFFQMRM
jgi:hypothetical protein